MTTDFTLIRHGQTSANMAGILQGFLNTDLDETGIRQAECAAERLRDEKFDCIFSSDLKRAMQTAQIIARFHDLEVLPMKELREWHLGDLEGRPCAELKKQYPEIMHCFGLDGGEVVVPGGESRLEFFRRVADCLESMAEKHAGKRILLITHGGVLRAVFRHVVGMVTAQAMIPVTSNASYTHFVKRDNLWQLCCWNDVSHLKSVGVRASSTF